MSSVISLALSTIEIGAGLQLNGSTLSVIPSTDITNNVTAAAGSTLTLAGNNGSGATVVLGLTSIITLTGALQGLQLRINNQPNGYTLTQTDAYVGYTGTGGHTFTLPAVSASTSRVFLIKNRGTGTLTIGRTGADELFTTVAATSFSLVAGEGAMVVCDGTYWVITLMVSGVITA